MGTDGTRHASGCTFHLWYWRGESSLLRGAGAEPSAERVGEQTGGCGHPSCESQAQTWGLEEPKCHKSLLPLWTQRGALKSLGMLDFSGTQ